MVLQRNASFRTHPIIFKYNKVFEDQHRLVEIVPVEFAFTALSDHGASMNCPWWSICAYLEATPTGGISNRLAYV